jgi:hypothetical protein
MKSLRWWAPLLILLLASIPGWAKGPTTRVVITAPSLPVPIEISDARLLNGFVVWSGPGVKVNGQEQSRGFIIDWPAGVVVERPAGLPRYEVSFYVRHANRLSAYQQERLAYVVTYEPDPRGGGGYVSLPGRGDERYALNTTTIFRGPPAPRVSSEVGGRGRSSNDYSARGTRTLASGEPSLRVRRSQQ